MTSHFRLGWRWLSAEPAAVLAVLPAPLLNTLLAADAAFPEVFLHFAIVIASPD